MILVMLQNAWSHSYRSMTAWPYERWLVALRNSRSGQRLKVIFDTIPCTDVVFENATTKVGSKPSDTFVPDPDYVRERISFVKPHRVLACGLHAEVVVSHVWPGEMLAIPHPAYRVLTNDLLLRAKKMLLTDKCLGRKKLKQLKQGFEVLNIPKPPDPNKRRVYELCGGVRLAA